MLATPTGKPATECVEHLTPAEIAEPPAYRSKWRSRAIMAAKLAFATGLILWLILSGQLELARLASIPLSVELALLAALLFGAMAIPCLRWWWLLRIQEVREPFWRIVNLTWAGYFANLMLPGAAGGDLAKSYLILRHRSQARARAFSTVLVDRFIGLYAFLFLGSLSILWLLGLQETGPSIHAMAAVTVSLLLGMTVASAIVLYGRSRSLLLWILPPSWRLAWNESFELYRRAPGRLFGCFGLSLVSSALTIACFAVAAALLGDPIHFGATWLVGPLVVLANSLPITPGGIGVAETVSSKLFAGFGSTSGAEIMLAVRIWQMLLALPGLAALLVGPAHHPERHGTSNDPARLHMSPAAP